MGIQHWYPDTCRGGVCVFELVRGEFRIAYGVALCPHHQPVALAGQLRAEYDAHLQQYRPFLAAERDAAEKKARYDAAVRNEAAAPDLLRLELVATGSRANADVARAKAVALYTRELGTFFAERHDAVYAKNAEKNLAVVAAADALGIVEDANGSRAYPPWRIGADDRVTITTGANAVRRAQAQAAVDLKVGVGRVTVE